MINALVLFKMDAWVTDEMKTQLQSTSLANAKQIVCGTVRDDAIVDIAATTVNDLNGALARLSEVKGVKSATVVRLVPGS
jgi:ABC-type transport system involved in cytochrome c biogenesis ATPase subunit